MACRLISVKPLFEPMLCYCQLDSQEQTSVKLQSKFKHFIKEIIFQNVIHKLAAILSPPQYVKWNELLGPVLRYGWVNIPLTCLTCMVLSEYETPHSHVCFAMSRCINNMKILPSAGITWPFSWHFINEYCHKKNKTSHLWSLLCLPKEHYECTS